ncbi:MAG: VanZ family protein [Bacteroidota bacterium]
MAFFKMNNTVQFIKNWLPAILWIICIFVLSTGSFSAENTYRILVPILRFFIPHITAAEVYTIHFFVRKAAHVTEYCIAGLLLFHSFHNTMRSDKPWRWVLYSLLLIIFIAATDEYHQSFVATRTSSMIDVGIDFVGGIIGQGVSVIFYKFRFARKIKMEPIL